MKLAIAEAESDALQAHLETVGEHELISSVLLETELRRAVQVSNVTQAKASEALSGIALLDASRDLFRAAGLLPLAGLRSLGAIHLATALRFEASVLLAYDQRLIAAAEVVGLATASPS